ncbi:amidohydrolase [Vicingus serpentipes]|jgi:omega-amidase|uniref:Omega-amidase YafV n=1 Tax=Vicingus serpentipes TaxID=1926625 RepID=A0A5C6RR14_9FLAO|nr:amidohydrolase [Vicingus serpentipes]TXB64718.1 amidohydrolase [Vicingus serpentipes]
MNLKITIIQSELHWENVEENLAMFAKKIEAINEQTDIVVLPEMFTTGFSMESVKLAEKMDGKSVKWMKQLAVKKNAVITGSIIIEEEGKYFNRLLWVQPDENVLTYDKRHLFRMAEEDKHFTAGEERLIVEWKGWKVCPLICYDLRFPVWSRNSLPAFDCLIYVANWPEARKEPWYKLLEARAIENQVYVVGVNRVGFDGKDISYSGNSAVIDPKGNSISNIKTKLNETVTIELNKQALEDFREKFPVGLDADDFEVYI